MLKYYVFYELVTTVTGFLVVVLRWCSCSFSLLTFLRDKEVSSLEFVPVLWLVFTLYWSVQCRSQQLTPLAPVTSARQMQRLGVGSRLEENQAPPGRDRTCDRPPLCLCLSFPRPTAGLLCGSPLPPAPSLCATQMQDQRTSEAP